MMDLMDLLGLITQGAAVAAPFSYAIHGNLALWGGV